MVVTLTAIKETTSTTARICHLRRSGVRSLSLSGRCALVAPRVLIARVRRTDCASLGAEAGAGKHSESLVPAVASPQSASVGARGGQPGPCTPGCGRTQLVSNNELDGPPDVELVEPIGVIPTQPYSAVEPARRCSPLGFNNYWDTHFAGRAAP